MGKCTFECAALCDENVRSVSGELMLTCPVLSDDLFDLLIYIIVAVSRGRRHSSGSSFKCDCRALLT